jgi:hypothetical protein
MQSRQDFAFLHFFSAALRETHTTVGFTQRRKDGEAPGLCVFAFSLAPLREPEQSQ